MNRVAATVWGSVLNTESGLDWFFFASSFLGGVNRFNFF